MDALEVKAPGHGTAVGVLLFALLGPTSPSQLSRGLSLLLRASWDLLEGRVQARFVPQATGQAAGAAQLAPA